MKNLKKYEGMRVNTRTAYNKPVVMARVGEWLFYWAWRISLDKPPYLLTKHQFGSIIELAIKPLQSRPKMHHK